MYRFLSIGLFLVMPFAFQPAATQANDGQQRDGPPEVQTVQHRHHHHYRGHHGHGHYHHYHYRPYGYNYYYYRPYSQRYYYYRPYGGYYHRHHGHSHFGIQTPWFRFRVH